MLVDPFITKIMNELKTQGRLRFKELLKIVNNPRTLSKKLYCLSSMGLIKTDEKGYWLTERGLGASRLIEELNCLLKEPEIRITNTERLPHRFYGELLRKYSEILYGHYKGRLLGLMVFGSIAKGDWDINSDIDLLVVMKGWEKEPVWERINELLELKNELKETNEYRNSLESGYRAIIQHYPLSKEEALEFHRIYMDACIDGIILYEKDGFLTNLMRAVKEKLTELGAKRVVMPNKRHYWVISKVKAGEVYQL